MITEDMKKKNEAGVLSAFEKRKKPLDEYQRQKVCDALLKLTRSMLKNIYSQDSEKMAELVEANKKYMPLLFKSNIGNRMLYKVLRLKGSLDSNLKFLLKAIGRSNVLCALQQDDFKIIKRKLSGFSSFKECPGQIQRCKMFIQFLLSNFCKESSAIIDQCVNSDGFAQRIKTMYTICKIKVSPGALKERKIH